MGQRIKTRCDISANWVTANPTLQLGEVGFDTTLKLSKTGDGVTAWNLLVFDYAKGSLVEGVGIVNAAFKTAAPYILSTSHGLGVVPDIVQAYYQCVIVQHGYSVGDRVLVDTSQSGYPNVSFDASKVTLALTAAMPNILLKTGAAAGALIAANWRINVRCWAIK